MSKLWYEVRMWVQFPDGAPDKKDDLSFLEALRTQPILVDGLTMMLHDREINPIRLQSDTPNGTDV